MTDFSNTIAESHADLSSIPRAEQARGHLGRGRWYTTIASAYLGLFVWAPFFDSLWIDDLPRFQLGWLAAGAVFASLLCYGLLFYLPASWGVTTGRPLGLVAASTFGTVGSEWITGFAIGVANIFWYAVAIHFAVDTTLLGLRACGLINAANLSGWDLGPISIRSPVFLCTAAFWIYITGMSGLLKLTGVVAALMRVYSPIVLLLLTGVALWMVPDLTSYRPADARVIARHSNLFSRWGCPASGVQLMTGYFAMAGLISVDWGARARTRRDLVLGGLTGIFLAASWTAVGSLIVVAGAAARIDREGGWFVASVDDPIPLSFRWGVFYGIGGIAGGAILILFGLAALAPACYSVWGFGQKLSMHWPRLGQSGWTWIGAVLAFVVAATSLLDRLDLIFRAMGLVFSPVVGAMAGDWLRQGRRWSGSRQGINRLGVIAWGAGFAIALVIEFVRTASGRPDDWWQPTAIHGCFTAAAVYWLLARLGREHPAVTSSSLNAASEGRVG